MLGGGLLEERRRSDLRPGPGPRPSGRRRRGGPPGPGPPGPDRTGREPHPRPAGPRRHDHPPAGLPRGGGRCALCAGASRSSTTSVASSRAWTGRSMCSLGPTPPPSRNWPRWVWPGSRLVPHSPGLRWPGSSRRHKSFSVWAPTGTGTGRRPAGPPPVRRLPGPEPADSFVTGAASGCSCARCRWWC